VDGDNTAISGYELASIEKRIKLNALNEALPNAGSEPLLKIFN
jgi:hypothetical protein